MSTTPLHVMIHAEMVAVPTNTTHGHGEQQRQAGGRGDGVDGRPQVGEPAEQVDHRRPVLDVTGERAEVVGEASDERPTDHDREREERGGGNGAQDRLEEVHEVVVAEEVDARAHRDPQRGEHEQAWDRAADDQPAAHRGVRPAQGREDRPLELERQEDHVEQCGRDECRLDEERHHAPDHGPDDRQLGGMQSPRRVRCFRSGDGVRSHGGSSPSTTARCGRHQGLEQRFPVLSATETDTFGTDCRVARQGTPARRGLPVAHEPSLRARTRSVVGHRGALGDAELVHHVDAEVGAARGR